jgi:branched-subunit amino acid aminotransferase/4-amino-4-deoxychorismate lyase
MELCRKLNIPIVERRVSLSEFYAADEVFTTGTMGELTPVNEIDGRMIGSGVFPDVVLAAIMHEYRALTETEGTPLPF